MMSILSLEGDERFLFSGFIPGSYRDRFLHVLLVEQSVIDAQDDPVEQGAVQRLSHGVSGCDSLEKRREKEERMLVVRKTVRRFGFCRESNTTPSVIKVCLNV